MCIIVVDNRRLSQGFEAAFLREGWRRYPTVGGGIIASRLYGRDRQELVQAVDIRPQAAAHEEYEPRARPLRSRAFAVGQQGARPNNHYPIQNLPIEPTVIRPLGIYSVFNLNPVELQAYTHSSPLKYTITIHMTYIAALRSDL